MTRLWLVKVVSYRYYMVMPDSNLPYLIERLGGLLRARQRVAGAEQNLLPVQQDVLKYLTICNRYSNTPAAVGGYLLITKGTASQTIRVLERRGLLRKVRDDKDGRSVRLSLTAKGKQFAKSLYEDEAWRHVSGKITESGQVVAETVLTELLRSLQRENDYKTFGQCKNCRHFQTSSPGQFQCGLTQESLTMEETTLICHEHEPSAQVLTY